MKLPITIILILFLLGSFYFSDVLFKTLPKSKTKFNYELKFSCTTNHWDQFTNFSKARISGKQKSELKIPVISTSNSQERYELVMSHIFHETKIEESTRLSDGKFRLIDEQGQYIFGFYEGYIDDTKNQKDVLLFQSIEGGIGEYCGVKGHLSATCVLDSGNPTHRNLTLKGMMKQLQKYENTYACL